MIRQHSIFDSIIRNIEKYPRNISITNSNIQTVLVMFDCQANKAIIRHSRRSQRPRNPQHVSCCNFCAFSDFRSEKGNEQLKAANLKVKFNQ